MDTTPRALIERRTGWLVVIWVGCALLPEAVHYFHWHFLKLSAWLRLGLSMAILVAAVQLTARLMRCPVCKRQLPMDAYSLGRCPHCGVDYDQPMRGNDRGTH